MKGTSNRKSRENEAEDDDDDGREESKGKEAAEEATEKSRYSICILIKFCQKEEEKVLVVVIHRLHMHKQIADRHTYRHFLYLLSSFSTVQN